MLLERLPPPPLRWRLFALAITLFAAPAMVQGLAIAGNGVARNSAVGLVGIIGLLGHAFGFRLGPLIFWKFAAVIFSVGACVRVAGDLAAAAGGARSDVPGPLAVAIFVAALCLWCFALFRHAELFGSGPRRPARKDKELAEIFS